jgi:hypothetical protein
MISEEPESEFYEDFGAEPPSESEIDEMITRARVAGDVPLRRALKYHLALRYISEQLLQRAEEGAGEGPDALLKLSKFMIRGEGAIGSEIPLKRPWWKFW